MATPKISKDIRDYLVNTVGLTAVSVNKLAPLPINQYAVFIYPGLENVKVHGAASGATNVAFDQAMIQVCARHTQAETALTNIHTIVDAIDGLPITTINGTVYTDVCMSTHPRIINWDESGAVTYAAEFRVQARRA